MTKKLLSLFGLVMIASLILHAAEGRKKRVAIMDFDYGTVQSYTTGLFGSNVDVGRGMSALLIKRLVQDGTYSVIERQALEKIMQEQNFSNSDRANSNSAAKLGKLLGVDAIIVGSITQFGEETKKIGANGGGYNWHGVGAGAFGKKNTKAIVIVDARIVDVDTGEILAVADGKGESSRGGLMLGGSGGNWGGGGGGAVDFGSSDFQNTILGEAVRGAMDQLSAGVIADATKLQARTITVEAVIADVSGSTITLNKGASSGIKVGDHLNVERVTREIKDPSTGEVIRRATDPVGTIAVTEAGDKYAVCSIVSGSGFKVGDTVKSTTQ